jgi:cytochrome c oxidase subunit 2
MKLLILLVVVVGIVAVAQLARVYELTAKLRKTKEEEISYADNRLNAALWIVFMVLFYAGVIYLFVAYGDYLPTSASAHGESVDTLMGFNMIIIVAVFFVVNTLLFYFASKYYYRKDRKAKFFPHDNRLELIWTVIPSIVLAVIIIYGLRTWNDMTGVAADDALRVEIYSKQFDWTARYAGNDGEFGVSSYNLITPTNPLGIVTKDGMAESLAEINESRAKLQQELAYERGLLLDEKASIEKQLQAGAHHDHDHGDHGDHADHDHGMSPELKANLEKRLAEIESMLASDKVVILTDAAIKTRREKLKRLDRHVQRIMELEDFNFDTVVAAWEAGKDDKVIKGEFHLPVGKEVEFIFRSRDVIHSAYMPHFRAQMNCVPGVPTRFKMTPTITTDSMRLITGDEDFDFVLLCNKVCGAAHFNMQMKIVVETEEQYKAWLEQLDTFYVQKPEEGSEGEAPVEETPAEATDVATEGQAITAALKQQ